MRLSLLRLTAPDRLRRRAAGAMVASALALLGGACANCAHGAAGSQTPPLITIVYSDTLVGHLDPCGCSRDQRGGIARAASTIEGIRREHHPVLVLDGGDRFFPASAAPDDPMLAAQQQLQAAAMANATVIMKYDAIVLGARDAWAGAAFFKDFPVPLLDTGTTAQPFTKTTLLLDAGGVPVGVFSVDSQADAADVIRARAGALRAEGARIVVLLAYRTFEASRALLPAARAAGVSLVLTGRVDDPETHDSMELADSDPPMFSVHARGEALLRIDLRPGGDPAAPFVKVAGQAERQAELDALQARIDQLRKDAVALSPLDPVARLKTEKALDLEARRAKLAAAAPPKMPAGQNVFTYAFVPMSPDLPQAKPVRALIDQYDADVNAKNFAWAQAHPKQCPRAREGQPSYSGDQSCIDCHEEAYDFWKTTPHSHAYADLVKRKKQYDVTCIKCHVLGYEQPGGACDIAQVAGRENVQCESCHGPGSLHVADGDTDAIRLKVPVETCRGCHDPENSPHFNEATYRPQILGPGHGFPLKKKKA